MRDDVDAVCARAGGPPDAVASPPVPECHCARILPALRRWVEALDGGFSPDSAQEYVDADAALEALAREVTHG